MPSQDVTTTSSPAEGCAWWNLACQGAEHAADAGMSALTQSIASGAQMLMSILVRELDESATVPLADPTYREVYFGFLGLAAPVIGVILLIAVLVACVRRDAATLGRAVVGLGVAGLGGAFYIVFAQLLVAIDNWLSHGVVRVTGYDFARSIEGLAAGFESIAGDAGEYAANMLLILLMMIMLVAALILWFVMVFRKIAILVVVAFAPLLIAGYLWAPTRRWVVRLTEVLIALVFTKTAIFTLFGVGLALLSRGSGESLGDFVGATVLMCGACFAPVMMLRLVHFAADTQLAGDALNTLRGGAAPVTSRIPTPGAAAAGLGRHDHARSQGQAPRPDSAEPKDPKPIGVDGNSAADQAGAGTGTGTGAGTGNAASGAASGGSAEGGAAGGGSTAGGAGAAGAAAEGAAAGAAAAQAADRTARGATDHAAGAASQLDASTRGHPSGEPDGPDPTSRRRGPAVPGQDNDPHGGTP
jgi:type IV secretion system protein TrbL